MKSLVGVNTYESLQNICLFSVTRHPLCATLPIAWWMGADGHGCLPEPRPTPQTHQSMTKKRRQKEQLGKLISDSQKGFDVVRGLSILWYQKNINSHKYQLGLDLAHQGQLLILIQKCTSCTVCCSPTVQKLTAKAWHDLFCSPATVANDVLEWRATLHFHDAQFCCWGIGFMRNRVPHLREQITEKDTAESKQNENRKSVLIICVTLFPLQVLNTHLIISKVIAYDKRSLSFGTSL